MLLVVLHNGTSADTRQRGGGKRGEGGGVISIHCFNCIFTAFGCPELYNIQNETIITMVKYFQTIITKISLQVLETE